MFSNIKIGYQQWKKKDLSIDDGLGGIKVIDGIYYYEWDAAYFRNLKTELDSAANKVTGHNRSPWFSMGDAGPGIVDDVIHAGEPVSFRRSNWDVLWKDPRSLVFSGVEPITEDRAEFLTTIRDSYSNRLYLNIGE